MKGDEMANYSGYTTEDNSRDKGYFVIVPQIIWGKARDTYDLTFWLVVKMIAGESKECYLTTKQMAIACMMGEKKVESCRKYWLKTGLLRGELRRDRMQDQKVWHLRIPDVWPRNMNWRQQRHKLLERIYEKAEDTNRLSILGVK